MDNIEGILEKTLKLVKECSMILIKADNDRDGMKKEDGSLVTKYDLMIDNKLTEGLKNIINCPILSEEHDEKIGDTYFVIDPIDGTHNFSRGFECFGIMVAYVEKGDTIFSIIDLPLLNRTYTAIKGNGAFVNGKKIQVRNTSNRLIGNVNTKAIIEYGKKLDDYDEYKFEFRNLYCACVPICYVANGIFDFTIQSRGLGIWDIIAPKLILEEASGVCEVTKYNETKYSIIAGNSEVVRIIKKVIS